jgi:sec-independent protein translocase protein TatA
MDMFVASFLSGIGMGELVVVFLIVLVIFGAGKLPQIGDALGKGIRNFKSSVTGEEEKKIAETEAKAADSASASKGNSDSTTKE